MFGLLFREQKPDMGEDFNPCISVTCISKLFSAINFHILRDKSERAADSIEGV